MESLETIKGYKPKEISENLNQKIFSAMTIISQFYELNDGKVHVSYSGGMDSTVLLHISRRVKKDIKALHLDTMQEYKGVKEQVRRTSNVVIIKPEMTFTQVVNKFGYPVISKRIARMIYDRQHPTEENKRTRELNDQKFFDGDKGKVRNSFYFSDKHRYLLDTNIPITHKCCNITKEKPLIKYRKQNKEGAIIGMLADESSNRKRELNGKCINTKSNTCNPFKGWSKQDVLEYAYVYKLRFASEYGTLFYDGTDKKYKTTKLDRTGCKGCLFGCNTQKEAMERMEILKETDIKSYNSFMDGGEIVDGYLRPKNGFGYRKIIEQLKE